MPHPNVGLECVQSSLSLRDGGAGGLSPHFRVSRWVVANLITIRVPRLSGMGALLSTGDSTGVAREMDWLDFFTVRLA